MATEQSRRIQFHIDSVSGLAPTSPNRTLGVSVRRGEERVECGHTTSVKRRDGVDPTWQENLPWISLTDFSIIQFDVTQRIPWTKKSRVVASSASVRLDNLVALQGGCDRGSSLRLTLTPTKPQSPSPSPSTDAQAPITLILNIRELSSKDSLSREAAAFVRRASFSSIQKTVSSDLVEHATILQLGAAQPKVHFIQ